MHLLNDGKCNAMTTLYLTKFENLGTSASSKFPRKPICAMMIPALSRQMTDNERPIANCRSFAGHSTDFDDTSRSNGAMNTAALMT
jgi:hypothetical protein